MTYEKYEKERAALQQREKNAKEQIASEQGLIVNLKSQIADLAQKIITVKQEIYAILGITENDVIAAETEIATVRQQLEFLSGFSPEDLRQRQKEIDAQQLRIAEQRKSPCFFIWKIRDQLLLVGQLLDQVKTHVAQEVSIQRVQPAAPAAPAATSYTVRDVPGNRETLFQIAGRDSIYGDPEKWKLLYRANQEKIDKQFQQYLKENPEKKYLHPEDLIFPGQVLEVPR